MTKQELRSIYLPKRMGLSDQACDQLSTSCSKHFLSLLSQIPCRVLHCFLPIIKNKEVNTWKIIEAVEAKGSGIRVAAPRVDKEGHLTSYYLEKPYRLNTTSWGIPEPIDGTLAPEEAIDVVVVPLIMFDLRGHRVGYGKGYYDKFLSACKPTCVKVGLSFFPPVAQIDDTGPHDIPLDHVVTPEKIYAFG